MTSFITKELFDLLTDQTRISFYLDADSPHHYNYSRTVNITKLIEKPIPSLLAKLYVDTSDEVVKLVEFRIEMTVMRRSYPSRFKYPSLHGEFQFAFLMFHLGEDYEVPEIAEFDL